MTTIYRNYLIAKVGDKFVAQSQDDECFLVSSSQQRINTAIDDLWLSLERGAEPAWFAGSSAIDLDTFGPESVPSSGDPPAAVAPTAEPYRISYWLFALTAIMVSAPISYFLEVYFPRRVDVLLTIGVCAVAIAFGRNFALLLSAIVFLVFNFCAVEPLLTFTEPSLSELFFSVLNVSASIGIPAIMQWQDNRRAASSARRIRDT